MKLRRAGERVWRLFLRTTSGLPRLTGSSSEKYSYSLFVQCPADRTWSQMWPWIKTFIIINYHTKLIETQLLPYQCLSLDIKKCLGCFLKSPEAVKHAYFMLIKSFFEAYIKRNWICKLYHGIRHLEIY